MSLVWLTKRTMCFWMSFAFFQCSLAGSLAWSQEAIHKKIVLLYTHRTLSPVNFDWDRGIVGALKANWEEPVEVEVEYLDLIHNADPDYLRHWIELLRTKYAERRPDIVIPIYGNAVEFLLENRDAVFPQVPIVFCSAPQKLAEAAHAEPGVTGVAFRFDFQGTFAVIQRLLPQSKRLLVVSGVSTQDQTLKAVATRELADVEHGWDIEFWEGLSETEVKQRMLGYGPETVLLLLSYDRDRLGNQYITQEFLKQIAADSKVPIFGLFDTLLGSGIVGGSLASAETQGKLAGELAARVLRGDRPEDIPLVGLDAHRLLFDARQLQRFHIPEARVPPHAEVAFRQKTTWEEFGRVIIFGGLGLVTQGLIIVSLLINRSRRLFAEREARELAGKILTAQEDERSYLARELHDDLSQRLAAVAIEAGRLDSKAADSPTGKQALGRLKQGLASICDDLHRLSHSMHPSLLDDFGLVDALRSECDSLSARTDMPIDFQSDHVPSDLPRNVALCLYRVAQEALWNAAKHSRASQTQVQLRCDRKSIDLEICDDGRGFDANEVLHAKGLGLASMRERIRLVGGSIRIQTAVGHGVKISVQVPLEEHQP